MIRPRTSLLAWLPVLILAFLPSVGHAGLIVRVNLDTSPLINSSAGPFALDFVLNNGNGDLNNTTIAISDFNFGVGGSAGLPGSIFTSDGASGSLSSSVTLTDTQQFFNEFYQEFTPGSSLSFTVDISSSDTGTTPDSFAFTILDSDFYPIPTLADDQGSLVTVDIRATTTANDVSTFATDTTVAGTVALDAPTDSGPHGRARAIDPGHGEHRRDRRPGLRLEAEAGPRAPDTHIPHLVLKVLSRADLIFCNWMMRCCAGPARTYR